MFEQFEGRFHVPVLRALVTAGKQDDD